MFNITHYSVWFSYSVVSDSLQPPWIAAHQATVSITNQNHNEVSSHTGQNGYNQKVYKL